MIPARARHGGAIGRETSIHAQGNTVLSLLLGSDCQPASGAGWKGVVGMRIRISLSLVMLLALVAAATRDESDHVLGREYGGRHTSCTRKPLRPKWTPDIENIAAAAWRGVESPDVCGGIDVHLVVSPSPYAVCSAR